MELVGILGFCSFGVVCCDMVAVLVVLCYVVVVLCCCVMFCCVVLCLYCVVFYFLFYSLIFLLVAPAEHTICSESQEVYLPVNASSIYPIQLYQMYTILDAFPAGATINMANFEEIVVLPNGVFDQTMRISVDATSTVLGKDGTGIITLNFGMFHDGCYGLP